MRHHPRRHPYAPLPCPDRLRWRGGRAVWARHSPERPESLRVTTPPRDEPCAPPPGLPRTPWRLAAALSRSMGLSRTPRTCRGQTGPRHGCHQCGIQPTGSDRTHRRERVIRPGKLYCLCLQGFVHSLISDTFPQVSGTGNSDGRTEEKRASQRAFSCKSASTEGKNGNIDFTPAAYRVTSQLPFRRSL